MLGSAFGGTGAGAGAAFAVQSRDGSPGAALRDMSQLKSFTFQSIENGCGIGKFRFLRRSDLLQAYTDLALNYFITIPHPRKLFNYLWSGRIISIETGSSDSQGLTAGLGYVDVEAHGYWYSTYDGIFNVASIASNPASTQIGSVVTGGYTPDLVQDTSGIVASGEANNTAWQVDVNSQTGANAFPRPGDVIKNLALKATTQDVRYLPQVWADRRLVTNFVTSSSPRYTLIANQAGVLDVRQSLANLFNKLYTRYKDSGGAVQLLIQQDASSQSYYSNAYGGSTAVPFVRVGVKDITANGNQSTPGGGLYPAVTSAGQSALDKVKSLRYELNSQLPPNQLLFQIRDNLTGQLIYPWEMQGGNFMNFGLPTVRLSAGLIAGAYAPPPILYVSQVDYASTGNALQLTTELSNKLQDVLR